MAVPLVLPVQSGLRHRTGQLILKTPPPSGGWTSCAHIIDKNYQVITFIFKTYGNLPLCLENYALFSLPPILPKKIHMYIKLYNLFRRTIG